MERRTWGGARGRRNGGGGAGRAASRQQSHVGSPTVVAMAHGTHGGCHRVWIGDVLLHEDGLLTQRLLRCVSVRRQLLYLVTCQLQQRLAVWPVPRRAVSVLPGKPFTLPCAVVPPQGHSDRPSC